MRLPNAAQVSESLAVDELVAQRARFISFVRSRVPDRTMAEDIVQSAFTQPLQERRRLQGAELTRWFYRVLRNAVVDRHRRASAESRGLERWQHDPTTQPEPVQPRTVCRCVRSALKGLPPKSQAVLEAVEIRGMTPASYAKVEKLSAGNAAVRLHRARRLLADRLKAICGTCTLDGCVDCDCGHGDGAAM
jgi:RNA polymerase sigma factor (sigma-70 family)